MFLSIITVCEAKDVCKNLSKVNNIDELLFQFYSHIDSQCIFEMPVEELEKALGIPVIDYESGDDWGVIVNKINKLKEGDGFFVIKTVLENGVTAFYIRLSSNYKNKNKGYGGSLSKGQYHKLLPPPQVTPAEGRINPPDSGEAEFPIPDNTVYLQQARYYWLNKAQSDESPILFFLTDYFRELTIMAFYSQAKTVKANIF